MKHTVISEISTPHGIFTDLLDKDGQIVKTAEEYYEWWLEQTQNPPKKIPTELEMLKEENKLLKAQIEALNSTTEFHEELIAEMAMMIYA